MGVATPESTHVTREVQVLAAHAAARDDARRRALSTNAITTLVAVAFATGPLWARAIGFGSVPLAHAAWAMLAAWLAFEAHVLALATLGASHPATRGFYVIDELARYAAPLSLIYFSGSASSMLWVVTLGKSFAFPPRTPQRARIDFMLSLVAHAGLLVAFIATGRIADGAFTGLVVLTVFPLYGAAETTLARQFHMRAERNLIEHELRESTLARDRDRIARELHDGVSADVNALLMRLRELGESGADPKAVALAERAQVVLDELRGVSWSLRNEQGTLAELGKLIDATCRRARGGLSYTRTPNREQGLEHIDAHAALTALSAARELVRAAATTDARSIKLALHATNALELRLECDGAGDADFAVVQRVLREAAGTLRVDGSSVVATIPRIA